MMPFRCSVALLLICAGCAGGDDPMFADDTGTGAVTSSTGSTTIPDPATTSSTTADDTTSTTADAESSSSSGGDSSSSSSSSSGAADESSSTGAACPVGTLGCPCDTEKKQPPCEEGSTCSEEDVCIESFCGPVDDEPNGNPFEPGDLGMLSDGDEPLTFGSELDGDVDVDWWRFSCADTILGDLPEPTFDLMPPETGRMCVYVDCQVGGNPSFDCPAGTEEDTAPIDFLPGCCAVDSTAFTIASPNCPDSQNDDLDVYIRVDGGAEAVCSAYGATYSCE